LRTRTSLHNNNNNNNNISSGHVIWKQNTEKLFCLQVQKKSLFLLKPQEERTLDIILYLFIYLFIYIGISCFKTKHKG
jgi:hypothetical protein